MRIILVRHGETEANKRECFADSDEIPLTDLGREQARELASRLAAEYRPGRLFSSSFLRARQTGEIIAQALDLKLEVIEGLHERDFGCLKGQPYGRMGQQTPSWRPEGGESLEDVQQRTVAVLNDLRLRYPEQEIVVVSHGAVIQSVCAHLTGEWSEAAVPQNCGLVAIRYDELACRKTSP